MSNCGVFIWEYLIGMEDLYKQHVSVSSMQPQAHFLTCVAYVVGTDSRLVLIGVVRTDKRTN